MSILKSLFGKKETTTPTWDIKPRAERDVAPKPRQSFVEPPPPPEAKKEPNPFLDDPMLDTMTLDQLRETAAALSAQIEALL